MHLQTSYQDQFWMDTHELSLFATVFNTCIHVWETAMNTWVYLPNKFENDIKCCIANEQNIYIYGDGVHFQVILKK